MGFRMVVVSGVLVQGPCRGPRTESEEGLTQEEVKDILYDKDRPDSLDTYIVIAIKIDDR